MHILSIVSSISIAVAVSAQSPPFGTLSKTVDVTIPPIPSFTAPGLSDLPPFSQPTLPVVGPLTSISHSGFEDIPAFPTAAPSLTFSNQNPPTATATSPTDPTTVKPSSNSNSPFAANTTIYANCDQDKTQQCAFLSLAELGKLDQSCIAKLTTTSNSTSANTALVPANFPTCACPLVTAVTGCMTTACPGYAADLKKAYTGICFSNGAASLISVQIGFVAVATRLNHLATS
ncbi:hypothetical protein HDU97_007794 [Phlyctochytrium planicorne]|nr:hypothetical protein HDU97_007794 [Phlyctochytrium planicorne]